jgi:hypothetical protein
LTKTFDRFCGTPVSSETAPFAGLLALADGTPVVSNLQLESDPGSQSGEFSLVEPSMFDDLERVLADWELATNDGYSNTECIELVHYLSQRGGDLAVMNPLERAIEDDLRVLGWICEQPELELRYDTITQPVERTRRLARNAIDQLMSNSSQWARRTTTLPVPREILGVVREEDVDIYENRVTRSLVVGLSRYLAERLREIEQHQTLSRLAAEARVDGWYRRADRIATALGNVDFGSVALQLGEVADRLRSLIGALRGLHGSILFEETPPRTHVLQLHPTNLLRNDHRYRKVAELWQLWSETEQLSPTTPDEAVQTAQRGAQAMDVFVRLVVGKALADLEFVARPSGDGVFDGPLAVAHLIDAGGTTVLQLDATGETTELRFVGIVTPLIDPNAVDVFRPAHGLRSAVREISTGGAVPIVVHATSGVDMRTVPALERYLLDHAGADSPDPLDDAVIVPASPLVADSLERIGRVIRRYTVEPLLLAYPPAFELSLSQQRLIASFETPGFRIAGQTLRITERLPATLGLDVDKWATREHSRSRSKEQRPEFADVIEFASRAGSYFEKILRCPTQPCNNKGDLTILEPRALDTFECTCRSCSTEWGLQTCGVCQARIPYIRPAHAVRAGTRPVDHFGADSLSAPCELDASRFICPKCRVCQGSDTNTPCGRCDQASGQQKSRTAGTDPEGAP